MWQCLNSLSYRYKNDVGMIRYYLISCHGCLICYRIIGVYYGIPIFPLVSSLNLLPSCVWSEEKPQKHISVEATPKEI